MLHDTEDSLDRSKLVGSTGSTAAGRPTAVAPALPGRTVTGCVILRNSRVIRVAARRVRLIREIPAYTRRSTGHGAFGHLPREWLEPGRMAIMRLINS